MKQVSLTRVHLDLITARLDLDLALHTKKTPTWGSPIRTHVKLGKSIWDPPRFYPIFPHAGIQFLNQNYVNYTI